MMVWLHISYVQDTYTVWCILFDGEKPDRTNVLTEDAMNKNCKLCQLNGSVPIIVFCGLIFISMKNAVIFGGDRRFLWKEKIAGSFGDTSWYTSAQPGGGVHGDLKTKYENLIKR